MKMPAGWYYLGEIASTLPLSFKPKVCQNVAKAQELMAEMADALEMADQWLSPDGYCLTTEKKIKDTINKFKEWK